MLDAIGPGHRVWWSKITRFPFLTAEGAGYNAAARPRRRRARRPRAVGLAGGAGGRADPALVGRHPPARRRRLPPALRADGGGRDRGSSRWRAAPATTLRCPPPLRRRRRSTRAIGPVRAFDTRTVAGRSPGRRWRDRRRPHVDRAQPGDRGGGEHHRRRRRGTRVPHRRTRATQPRPLASSGNYRTGAARSTMSVLPLTATRRLCVYSSRRRRCGRRRAGGDRADVRRGSRPTAPTRLLDTRETGRAAELVVAVPPGARRGGAQHRGHQPDAPGFVTAYPCGAPRPLVASVTFAVGETISDGAYVPVGAGGAVCLYANVPTDVVVDLTGTFAPDGALAFVAATPTRTYDTRDGTGGWTPIQGTGQDVDVRVAPPDAQAVTGVLTMVTPLAPGFLAAHGCGGRAEDGERERAARATSWPTPSPSGWPQAAGCACAARRRPRSCSTRPVGGSERAVHLRLCRIPWPDDRARNPSVRRLRQRPRPRLPLVERTGHDHAAGRRRGARAAGSGSRTARATSTSPAS